MKAILLNTITIFSLLLCISSNGISQDKVCKLNKDTISCKVLEIGESEVKYTLPGDSNLVYVLHSERLEKVILSNGKEFSFVSRMDDPQNYIGQKTLAFKVGFLSPTTGFLNLGMEKSLKPGRSLDLSLGIIGIGKQENRDSKGASVSAGIKFISTPDFYLHGMKRSHLLQGFYLKPTLNLSIYSTKYTYYDYYYSSGPNSVNKRETVMAGAFTLNFGKQWVMNNSFLVDAFVGTGLGFASNYDNYHYGLLAFQDFPVAFTAGLKMGFLVK